MDDKYFYALVGSIGGILLSAAIGFLKDYYKDYSSKKKQAEYLAIRLICIFDSFMRKCADVVGDDGTHMGQFTKEGYAEIQVQTPTLDLQIDDVDWKSLPPELMYEILYFPNIIKDADQLIGSCFDHSFPPDYSDGFEERQHQYTLIGLKAHLITERLRKLYKIPEREASQWDVVEFLNNENEKHEEFLRKRREAHTLGFIKQTG